MFLYIKDYFQKRIFHILLIVFCGLLMFNSIMTLIDLKNYEVEIVYSTNSKYYQITDLDETTPTKITFKRPVVKVKYKYATMPNKFTWVSGQLLEKNTSIENFSIEYKIYRGVTYDNLIDSFIIPYEKSSGFSDLPVIQREYEHVRKVTLDVVDYDIKFDTSVYVPHIFVIVGCLVFIVPSAVMLYKIRKEENGK